MPTVTHVQVTTSDDDDLGNTTFTTLEKVYPYGWPQSGGVLIQPRSSTARADSRQPAVITAAAALIPATLNLGAHDRLILTGHSPSMDGEWQAEGVSGQYVHPSGWTPGGEVALERVTPPPT